MDSLVNFASSSRARDRAVNREVARAARLEREESARSKSVDFLREQHLQVRPARGAGVVLVVGRGVAVAAAAVVLDAVGEGGGIGRPRVRPASAPW